MNKKGFTLIEIMGSIIIMGIIILIATSSFVGISKKMKEQAYKNKVKLIETKAEVYASETTLLDTNVDTLLKNGYIEADNNNDEVLNPVDDSIMNCHMVKVENDNGIYYAKYQEEEICDLGSLVKNADGLTITAKTASGSNYNSGEWTREDVDLTLSFSSNVDVNNIESILWNEDGYEEEIEINNNFNEQKTRTIYTYEVFDGNVSVEVYTKDKVRYTANIDVKIDKEAPVSYESDIKIDKEDEFTRGNKKVTITATDNNGSGINGYYVGTNSNCISNRYIQNNSNTLETDSFNGTYYVCVKDNVGNISKTMSYSVKKVDNRAPSCTISASSSGVYISYKTDGEGANDSGLNESMTYLSNDTLNSGLKYAYVYDNVGNMGLCSIDIADFEEKGYSTTTYYCNSYFVGYDVQSKTCESRIDNYTKVTETCKKTKIPGKTVSTARCKKLTKNPKKTCRSYNSCSACGCRSYGSWTNRSCYGEGQNGCEAKAATNPNQYRCETVTGCSSYKGMLQYRSCISYNSCSKCSCASYNTTCSDGYKLEGNKCVKYEYEVSVPNMGSSKSSCPSGSYTSVKKLPTCNLSREGNSYKICSGSNSNNYDFESNTTTSYSCYESDDFDCKSSTVGRSYVSSCSENTSYSWSYDSYTSYDYVPTSSYAFFCNSYHEGEEYVRSSTPIISNYFDSYSGWSPYEIDEYPFTCSSSTSGRSYTTSYRLPDDCPNGYNRIYGTTKCYQR